MAKYTLEQVQDLAEEILHSKDSGRPFALLTGAGCSISAGIPSAKSLIKEINETPKFKNRLRKLNGKEVDDYGLCMRQLPKNTRKELLTPHLKQAKVNWAHIAIASMMKEGFIERTLTFNFDNILNRANGLCGEYPAIYDYVTGVSDSTDHIVSPCIIHLHGQGYGLSMLNSDKETGDHAKRIKPLLRDTLDRSPILVIGYSGQADEVFPKISEVFDGKETLHWCDYEEEPSQNVKELLSSYEDLTHHYGGVDADLFLVQLAQALNCFPPKVFDQPLDHLRDEIKDVMPFPSSDDTSTKLDVLATLNTKLDSYGDNKSKQRNNYDYYQKLFMKGEYSKIINGNVKKVPKDILSNSYFSHAYNKGKSKNMSAEELNDIIRLYEKAIEITPNSGNCFNNLANTLSDLGKLNDDKSFYEKAIVKYEKAIEINPNDGSYYYNLGNTLLELGKLSDDKSFYEQAIVKYEKAIEINPNDSDYYNNLGDTLLELGKLSDDKSFYEQAIAKYEKAIGINPNDCGYYDNLGDTLIKLGQLTGDSHYYEKSEKVLNIALKYAPKNVYNLACVASLLGKENKCEEYLNICYEANTLPVKEHLETDDDLNFVRNQKWFKDFIDKL